MAQIFQNLHFCYLLIIQDVSISALQTAPIEPKLHTNRPLNATQVMFRRE
jgi:hypothetical protein